MQSKSSKKKPNPIVFWLLILAVSLCAFGLGAVKAAKQHPVKVESLMNTTALAMRLHPNQWFHLEKDTSALMSDIQNGQIETIGLANDAVLVSAKHGNKLDNYFVADNRYGRISNLILSIYHDKDKVKPFPVVTLANVYHVPPQTDWGFLIISIAGQLLSVLFLLSMVVGGIVLYRQNKMGGSNFALSKNTDIRFKDVIGASEAKSAMQDIVAYLKKPADFTKLGARPPHGVLMIGEPGTGKTRLAQAMAGECNVSFIAVNGSDFSSKFYGVAIQRVKALFKLARANAPCIIFIDEIDGVGKRTTSSDSPAAAESNRIVNQILVEMDGFKAEDGVIVIGATNLVDMLDPAMLREGRFDRRVHVKLPDLADRVAIFRLYAENVKVRDAVDFDMLGRLTTGLSPAAIAAIVNQAALLAAKLGHDGVDTPEFLEAIEISRMGEANGTVKALTPEERNRVAVHEAGHALIAQLLNSGRVEKVTILPRGGALGVTLVTPEEDKHLHLKSEIENRIEMLLGGRCAELAVFNEASTGAAQDLREASRLALGMVTEYGFGDAGSLFNLGAVPNAALIQPEMGESIQQAKQILARLEIACTSRIEQHRAALDQVVAALLEKETIPGSIVKDALEAERLREAA